MKKSTVQSCKEFAFVITEEMEEERIDKCLRALTESLSRAYLQRLLEEGSVTVNEKPVKASYRVRAEDRIRLFLPEAVTPDILPEDIPLSILYEDRDVIVINKPKGMVVHPAPGHYTGTLVNALLFHCQGNLSGINGVLRPGIVHRIDKDTTGSVIACKNDFAHAAIAEQLKEHAMGRVYHALVCGRLAEETGTIQTLLGRHPQNRQKMAVCSVGGKEAITHFQVLQRFSNHTYVKCTLETGRTHQIRVHMAYLGHPLLGDTVYGTGWNSLNRLPKAQREALPQGQCLHAKILEFNHPRTGRRIITDAPLPEYFTRLLSILI